MRSNAISFSPDGYFLTSVEGGEHPPLHTMGGPQSIPGAISPDSGAPLLLVATLNLRDARLHVPRTAVERLHLLYSWTCPISEGPFSYRETASGVELLQGRRGDAFDDFPYAGYPAFFPETSLALQRLTEEEQRVILKLNRREDDPIALESSFSHLAVPASQIGGEPRLLQWPLHRFECPECRRMMPLLAMIGNRNGSERGFTGNDFVQMLFFFCVACSVVTAENVTD